MDSGSVSVAALASCLGLAVSLTWLHLGGGSSWTTPEWLIAPCALLGVVVVAGGEGRVGGPALASVCALVAVGAGLLGEPTPWVRISLVAMGWTWIAYALLAWLGGTTAWGAILCAAGSLGTGLLLRPARERGRMMQTDAQQTSYDEWGVSSPSHSEVSDW